jgi:hypothetical protein
VSIGKRSFEALGKIAKKSGDTITRLLVPAEKSSGIMLKIAQKMFRDSKAITIVIDDTLLKKMFSKAIEGVGLIFDTGLKIEVLAYKLLVCSVTDGKYTLPLSCSFLFSKDVLPDPAESKMDIVKRMILNAIQFFPDKEIIVTFDGAFASKALLAWANQNGIAVEARMHSNRKVHYKGQKIAIRDIKGLLPKGRQMARTIPVLWHAIPLYITAQRRFDKHGNETFIFQAATFQAKPSHHVKTYQKRWGVEMLFRTVKQHLGLQECFSTKVSTQLNHVTAVLLAYALLQCERKRRKSDTPEAALRALKLKKVNFLKHLFLAKNQIFFDVYA